MAGATGGSDRRRRLQLGRRFAIAASLLGIAAPALASDHIVAPPATLKLDPFYAKYISADGIPIVASAQVPDRALAVARDLVHEMLAHRPDYGRILVRNGVRIAIMSLGEGTMDLPEQRDWKKPARDDPRLTRCERLHYDERIGRLSDAQYWNNRARGMSGPLTSAGAEDLLGDQESRYRGETIFVHEFSHNLLAPMRARDPRLFAKLQAAYAAAMRDGRWRGEYIATTIDEYWAEGTQYWFNSNKLAVVDGRRILSDEDLAAYDPALAHVLRAVYGERHHLLADPWYLSDLRAPPGPPPASTAEVC